MLYRLAKTSPDALILLPRDVLEKLDTAGLTEVRILLHAAARLSRGAWPEDELIHALEGSFRQDEIRDALAFWRGVGLLESTGDRDRAPAKKKAAPPEEAVEPTQKKAMPDPDVPPFYSGKDLEEAAKKDPGFLTLVSFVEQELGKVLNTGELAIVWSFLDYMKMPREVVMLIVKDCCTRGHGNLRYISRAVMSFQDQGLDTFEKAEAYYVRQDAKEKFARRIRKLFGLGDRALTKAEDAHLAEWMTWDFSDEMLDLAYEKTVSAAQKPSINYMHRILQNWHEAGFTAPAQVEQSGARPAAAVPAQGRGDVTFDPNAAFEAAVKRQRKGK